jgi:hypothetical protein
MPDPTHPLARLLRPALAFAALALAVLAAAPAGAQALEMSAADSVELRKYSLYPASFAAFLKVVEAMDQADRADPAALRALAGTAPAAASLDTLAARYEAVPAMRAALAEGGMTGREFALFNLTAIEAATAASLVERLGTAAMEHVRGEAARGNVLFFLQHRGEFERAFGTLRSVGRAPAPPG